MTSSIYVINIKALDLYALEILLDYQKNQTIRWQKLFVRSYFKYNSTSNWYFETEKMAEEPL